MISRPIVAALCAVPLAVTALSFSVNNAGDGGWRNIVERYGCEECGAVGWRRDGESIEKTGEENGVPVVTRIVSDPNAPGSSWMAECGHRIRPASALERFFSVLTPGESTALPPNF